MNYSINTPMITNTMLVYQSFQNIKTYDVKKI